MRIDRPKEPSSTMMMPVSEDKLSLSIIFRISSAATDRIAREEDLEVNTDSSNQMATLDLVICSHNDFELFVSTIRNLMFLNHKYFTSMHRDVLLLQHHWMELGKPLSSTINKSEWSIICCDRLSVDVGRNAVLSLFRKFCGALNSGPEEEITLANAVGLLEHIRRVSLSLKSISDPCENVWNRIESSGKGSKPLAISGALPNNDERDMLVFNDDQSIGGDSTIAVQKAKVREHRKGKKIVEEYMSVEDFLHFIHREQKDKEMTLSDARSLFERLNAQTYASQLGKDGSTRKNSEEKFSKDYITKTVFLNYLRSDANDAFNPVLGEIEYDDMSRPLSAYWINASHDTYLKSSAPLKKQVINGITAPVDVSMYTTALNRGVRCLEVDVWDGGGTQKGQPVVRFDEDKGSGISGNSSKSGILFSDVIKALHSFLTTEPSSLPILLFVESHCDLKAQERMANCIQSTLAPDDMIFVPSEDDFDTRMLPSPADLRGKVVLKFKIPGTGKSRIIYDDLDDLNDIDPFHPTENAFEDEMDISGDNGVGSILFESSRDLEKRDPDELVKDATVDMNAAKKAADAAEDKAFNANVKVNRANDFSNKLMKKAGLSTEQVERNLNKQLGIVTEIPTNEEDVRSRASQGVYSECDESMAGETFNGGTVAGQTVADETIGSGGSGGSRGAIASKKTSVKGFFGRLMGWADSLDGDASVANASYLEDREVADSMDDSINSSLADSRDGVDSECDDVSMMFDLEVDVKTFSELPQNLMETLRERKAEQALEKKRKAERKLDKFTKFQMNKKSISNVEKKLESINEDTDKDGGVEVQHFYSSTIDDTLLVHQEAELAEEKASKVLGTATAIFNKRQQEYETAKKNFDMVERLISVETQLKIYLDKKIQAETTTTTARSEFQISEERAVETAENAVKAREEREEANRKEQIYLEKEKDLEEEFRRSRMTFEEKSKLYDTAKTKLLMVKHEHEKVTENIKKIEGSHRYKVEKRAASRGALSEDTEIRKQKMEVEKQLTLNKKLRATKQARADADQEREEASQALERSENNLRECRNEIGKLKEFADNYETYVEQMDQLAEEEKDAAKMREEANKKADSTLQQINGQIHKLKTKIDDINLVKEDNMNSNDVVIYERACSIKKKKLDEAEVEFRDAQEAYRWADARLKDANDVLNENSDVLYKAKADAVQLEHRVNAEEALKQSAIKSYERLLALKKEADVSKEKAARLVLVAAEKTSALRRAKDFKQRLTMVTDISPKLVHFTLLNSSKFKYFEDSLTLPSQTAHNVSEGKLMQLLTQDMEEVSSQLIEFNRNHLTRIFPSRQKKVRAQTINFNPVLPWSLGCQIASMNQQICDAFVLINDGRFRANGSCGYVLKPESMQRNGNSSRRSLVSSKWRFKTLSGYNLPKSRKKAVAGAINPRVRVTLYDGGSVDPLVHLTSTVPKNGLNPVWNESEGAVFDDVKYPECAVVLFSVWDFNEEGTEDFIAAAGIPLTCMREGYRSVPLFDANHMRCGAHAFTSLFIHVTAY